MNYELENFDAEENPMINLFIGRYVRHWTYTSVLDVITKVNNGLTQTQADMVFLLSQELELTYP